MIATVLGWTKLPQWTLELIVVAAAAGGIWYWQHHLIGEGISQQKAADDAASAPLIQQAKAETAVLQVKATMAEQAHAKEVSSLQSLIDSHPNQPVRLCVNTHDSGSSMRASSAANSGASSTGTPAAGLQPVPIGDSASGAGQAGPNIEPMLTALGAAADRVSAALREFQSR